MKVSVQNLGAIEEAQIEIGDLTIIVGENSTGKTNLVYTIWDIIRRTADYFTYAPQPSHKQEIQEYISKQLQKNDLKNKFQEFETPLNLLNINDNLESIFKVKAKGQKVREIISELLVNELNSNFNLNILNSDLQLDFKNIADEETYIDISHSNYITSINTEITYDTEHFFLMRGELFDNKITYGVAQDSSILRFDESQYTQDKVNKIETEIHTSFLNSVKFKDYLEISYKSICKSLENTLYNNNSIEIATSERAGIISFLSDNQKNLRDMTRIQALNKKGQLSSNFMYTLPVTKNIDFINALPDIIETRIKNAKIQDNEALQENSILKPVYEEIEKMIGGSLIMNQMGEIRFTKHNKQEDERSLKFNNLSSSIKHLTMIYMQLKYSEIFKTIDKNTYYVIEEPEAFLHPTNQIKMARILAMLVNFGIKVIITTHSDFLMKEFNTLITLGSNDVDKEKYEQNSILKNLDYRTPLNINTKNINIYSLKNNGRTEKLNLSSNGVNCDTFDNAIEEQNKILNAVNKVTHEKT